MNNIHSSLRDASPDARGRRLIDFKYTQMQPTELDYLLLSGSNRIGALDFQLSSAHYQPRDPKNVSLEEFLEVAAYMEAGKPIPSELDFALLRGTNVGGARPKALIQSKGKEYIAKFGLSQDPYPIIKAEFAGMQLAKKVSINVAPVSLTKVLGKDILLVERFDRNYNQDGITRRLMLSGLSLLNLNEMEARYASYCDLTEIIRRYFDAPHLQLLELYRRLIFNVLIGNTDDHARNHSAFWDGKKLQLTPAYDLCPQLRLGQEATQAMSIDGSQGNFSTLNNVLSISEYFQVTPSHAHEIMEHMIITIKENWESTCEEAEMSNLERDRLWGTSIFNPFCFQGFNTFY
jgi:serine/threonine-protein kinase HipA